MGNRGKKGNERWKVKNNRVRYEMKRKIGKEKGEKEREEEKRDREGREKGNGRGK